MRMGGRRLVCFCSLIFGKKVTPTRNLRAAERAKIVVYLFERIAGTYWMRYPPARAPMNVPAPMSTDM